MIAEDRIATAIANERARLFGAAKEAATRAALFAQRARCELEVMKVCPHPSNEWRKEQARRALAAASTLATTVEQMEPLLLSLSMQHLEELQREARSASAFVEWAAEDAADHTECRTLALRGESGGLRKEDFRKGALRLLRRQGIVGHVMLQLPNQPSPQALGANGYDSVGVVTDKETGRSCAVWVRLEEPEGQESE